MGVELVDLLNVDLGGTPWNASDPVVTYRDTTQTDATSQQLAMQVQSMATRGSTKIDHTVATCGHQTVPALDCLGMEPVKILTKYFRKSSGVCMKVGLYS